MNIIEKFLGSKLKKSEKAFNTVKLLEIVIAVFFIIFGIVLVTNKISSEKTIAIFLGLLILFDGILNIYSTIMPDSNDFYKPNIVFGIANIIVTFFLFTNLIKFVNYLKIYYGIYLALCGIKTLILAINLKRAEDKSSLIISAMAALTLALGGLMIFYPFQSFNTFETIAIFSILYGILTINNANLLKNRVKKLV